MPTARRVLLCLSAAVLPLLVPSRALDLTEDNFNRHVYERKGGGHSFVKFYAPWCQHCKKLAPTWKAVEKVYPKSAGLLVGSVDCSDGPKGRNPLCDKHKAMSLPTLMYFHSDKKKGTSYDGNRTEDDLLAFAAELNSTCSLTERDECTDEQAASIEEYDALDEAKLKEKVSELSSAAEMARMKMMMVQMQMQQTYQDKKLGKVIDPAPRLRPRFRATRAGVPSRLTRAPVEPALSLTCAPAMTLHARHRRRRIRR